MISHAMEVFDGAMLSDAGLAFSRRADNAFFSIGLSGKEHMDWLYYIRGALRRLGVEACNSHPKASVRTNFWGKPYCCCVLATKVSPFLTEQYARWRYRRCEDGWIKGLPDDICLTPITLANWFMGDGSSRRRKRKWSVDTISTKLHTQGFTLAETGYLEDLLEGAGFATGREYVGVGSNSRVVLTIRQKSVDEFMAVVRPYILLSYMYKVKFREGMPIDVLTGVSDFTSMRERLKAQC